MTSICISPYTSGSCPLSSITDANACFNNDIQDCAEFVAIKLGALSVGVELHSSNIYNNVQQAYLEFSNYVNYYSIKANLSSILGQSTGSLSGYENKFIHPNLELYKRISAGTEIEAGIQGNYTTHSASFTLTQGTQQYDLQAVVSTSSRIHVLDVWWSAPWGAQRYYPANDYTTSVMLFGAGSSFTSDTAYYLLPVWQDVSRVQAYKFSFKFRRSQYSYDLNNNIIRIYPSPSSGDNGCLIWFTYRTLPDPINPDFGFTDSTVNGVANLSNAPYGLISWCSINQISKQWIRRFAVALSTIDLGNVRSKYSSVPIPGAEVTLNGPQLVEQGNVQIENLRQELKEELEDTLPKNMAIRDAELLDAMTNIYKKVPIPVFRF